MPARSRQLCKVPAGCSCAESWLSQVPDARGKPTQVGDPSCPPVSSLLDRLVLAPALPEHQIVPLAAPGVMHPPAQGKAVFLQPSRS